MTSNIGSKELKNSKGPGPSLGFGTSAVQSTKTDMAKSEHAKKIIKNALAERLAPEFINRIDDIIIFASLAKDNIYRIIDLEIKTVASKLKDMGYTLTITDNVKDFLIENGYDEEMGARPMKRAIQTYIEDPISDEILRKTVTDVINIDYDKAKKVLLINNNPVQEKLKFVKKMALIVETKFDKFIKTLK